MATLSLSSPSITWGCWAIKGASTCGALTALSFCCCSSPTLSSSLLRLILASTWPSNSSLGEQNAPANHPSFLLQHHCPEKLPEQPPALTPDSRCPTSVPGAWEAGWPRTYSKPVSYQRPGACLSVAEHEHAPIPPPTTARDICACDLALLLLGVPGPEAQAYKRL